MHKLVDNSVHSTAPNFKWAMREGEQCIRLLTMLYWHEGDELRLCIDKLTEMEVAALRYEEGRQSLKVWEQTKVH